ncbi:MAG TPA: bifunctional oligoribonuclease/PAP phosphatase NrnA [Thermomicrobiales bacterium]|nr:bifunctional oligoribonuclease/PAP phosphatase NrnA [Thermomicrobiales bacterium]
MTASSASGDKGGGSHEHVDQLPALSHALRDMIVESRRPVILTHADPDADAIASVLGMKALCEHLGVTPRLATSGDGSMPANLIFVHEAETLRRVDDDAVRVADLIIFVDAADADRLGPLFYRLPDEFERRRPTINIDHHITNHRFATLNIVLPEAAATSEIIVAMFDALGLELEPRIATTLMAGIFGDTLGLRTPSTTPTTLRIAAELMEAGADLDLIVDHLFRLKPYSTICLWAEVLQRAEWRGALIWSQIDPEMLARSGADRTEGEGIVNFLAGTIGARASALLHEEPWGWRVSMRSIADDVDVSAILQRHGGGGHQRAAGARLPPGIEARDHFLDDIATILGPRIDNPSRFSAGADPV